MLCDGALYGGAAVVVIGGGDAAVDAALQLLRIASAVTLIHRYTGIRVLFFSMQGFSLSFLPKRRSFFLDCPATLFTLLYPIRALLCRIADLKMFLSNDEG